MGIGERLKEARKYRGVSQRELAKMIGVSKGVISNVEYELATPQQIVIRSIADMLDINEHWLKTGEGNMLDDAGLEMSRRIVDEIMMYVNQLSPAEQDYILAMTKSFTKFKNNVPQNDSPTLSVEARIDAAKQIQERQIKHTHKSDDKFINSYR